MTHLKRFGLAGLFILTSVGCTGGDDTPPSSDNTDNRAVSVIEPVSPTGTLAGYFYDIFTGQPLSGVTVSVLNDVNDEGETLSGVTDGAGSFVLSALPASTDLAVRFQKEGYTSGLTTASIPSAAGNLAQDNGVGFLGPIGLLPIGGEGAVYPRYRLVDSEGTILSNMTVNTQLDVAFLNDGALTGSLPGAVVYNGETGTYDTSGYPDLIGLATSLPNVLIRTVALSEVDGSIQSVVMENTAADLTSTGVVEVVVEENDNAPPIVTMDGGMVIEPEPEPQPEPEPDYVQPDTILQVTYSNIADLEQSTDPILPSILSTMVAIDIRFSRPIHVASVYVAVENGDGDALSTGTPAVANSDIIGESKIVIPAPSGGWPAGEEVNLRISVLSLEGDQSINVSGSFLTQSPVSLGLDGTAMLKADNGQPQCPDNNGGYIEVRLTEAIGARFVTGDSALGGATMPIRLTSADTLIITQVDAGVVGDAGVDAGSHEPIVTGLIDPENPLSVEYEGDDYVYGSLYEPLLGFDDSGYTNIMRIPWTKPFGSDALEAEATTIDLALTVHANYIVPGQDPNLLVIRQASGAPAGTFEAVVQLETTQANGDACNGQP